GLGGSSNAIAKYQTWNQMAFSIDRVAVQARTRALSSNYTVELAQDLKAVHGLDAEAELANLLSTEILAEINREIVKTIYFVAKTGSQQRDLATPGSYDLDQDSDGRWSAERFRGLSFQIERECNYLAKETRRGRGNFIICDS
ncbi:MAG: ATP-binding protein, partial [bacterium]